MLLLIRSRTHLASTAHLRLIKDGRDFIRSFTRVATDVARNHCEMIGSHGFLRAATYVSCANHFSIAL